VNWKWNGLEVDRRNGLREIRDLGGIVSVVQSFQGLVLWRCSRMEKAIESWEFAGE
jgi:hypothetical protein